MKEIIVVGWKDHYDLEHAWVTIDEIPQNAAIIITVGFVVREDDDELVLARDMDCDQDKVGGVMIIHKPLIVFRQLLCEFEEVAGEEGENPSDESIC